MEYTKLVEARRDRAEEGAVKKVLTNQYLPMLSRAESFYGRSIVVSFMSYV